jgi:hypothetical protein
MKVLAKKSSHDALSVLLIFYQLEKRNLPHRMDAMHEVGLFQPLLLQLMVSAESELPKNVAYKWGSILLGLWEYYRDDLIQCLGPLEPSDFFNVHFDALNQFSAKITDLDFDARCDLMMENIEQIFAMDFLSAAFMYMDDQPDFKSIEQDLFLNLRMTVKSLLVAFETWMQQAPIV